jgi:hypothetical protein
MSIATSNESWKMSTEMASDYNDQWLREKVTAMASDCND